MTIIFISKKCKISTVIAYLSEVADGLQDWCLVYWSDQFLKDFSEQFMRRDKEIGMSQEAASRKKKYLLNSMYWILFLNVILQHWGLSIRDLDFSSMCQPSWWVSGPYMTCLGHIHLSMSQLNLKYLLNVYLVFLALLGIFPG